MDKIKFYAEKDKMSAQISNVPGFEGDVFGLNFPESIGSSETARWFDTIKCSWKEINDDSWEGRGWVDGELSYTTIRLLYYILSSLSL
ncbi:hypothetical protein ES705_34526 [subsurface metagenome]